MLRNVAKYEACRFPRICQDNCAKLKEINNKLNVLSEKKFWLKILSVCTNITLRIMNSLYKFWGLKMGSSSDEVLFSSFQDSAEPISSQSWIFFLLAISTKMVTACSRVNNPKSSASIPPLVLCNPVILLLHMSSPIAKFIDSPEEIVQANTQPKSDICHICRVITWKEHGRCYLLRFRSNHVFIVCWSSFDINGENWVL